MYNATYPEIIADLENVIQRMSFKAYEACKAKDHDLELRLLDMRDELVDTLDEIGVIAHEQWKIMSEI